jgi:hypothetical protein
LPLASATNLSVSEGKSVAESLNAIVEPLLAAEDDATGTDDGSGSGSGGGGGRWGGKGGGGSSGGIRDANATPTNGNSTSSAAKRRTHRAKKLAVCDAVVQCVSCMSNDILIPKARALLMELRLRYGARFSTGIYNRGCHWIPRLLA